jgi:uncharacterized protein (DUF983 family)
LGRTGSRLIMTDWQAPDTTQASIRGLCPRCGAPTLFAGAVRFSEACPQCKLDFSQFNVGDGPAAFLIMIVGAIVTIGAVMLELSAEPPFWVHILIWVPLTAALVVGLLRLAKGALLVLEYRNRAHEGRIVS